MSLSVLASSSIPVLAASSNFKVTNNQLPGTKIVQSIYTTLSYPSGSLTKSSMSMYGCLYITANWKVSNGSKIFTSVSAKTDDPYMKRVGLVGNYSGSKSATATFYDSSHGTTATISISTSDIKN